MERNQPFERVFLKDHPELMLQVSERVRHYTIAFLRTHDTPAPTQCGTGVLVKVGGRLAILTAAHVVDTLKSFKAPRLSLLLEPTDTLPDLDWNGIAIERFRGRVDREGPDLGVLLLAPSIGAAIEAKKPFFPLDPHRSQVNEPFRPDDEELWVAQGFPESKTTDVIDPNGGVTRRLYNFSGLGRPCESRTVGEHDYLELPIDFGHDEGPPPRDWGGMSGGGLWEVTVRRPDGALRSERPILKGLLFYQDEETGWVTAHGPKSIYGVAYDIIRGNG